MAQIKRLFLVLLLLLGCRKAGENPPAVSGYDYLLLDDADIIVPPSGSADRWIYLLGGERTGTYYVSPSGSDSNPGTRAQPWRTLAYAVAQLAPGDTLVILSAHGSRPVLAGGNNLRTAFDLSGRSYLWLENLEITHHDRLSGTGRYFREGVSIVDAPAHHIVFKNLYIHHLDEMGMDMRDIDSVELIGCRIEYCGFGSLGGPAGEHGGWRNVTLRGCTLSYSGHYYQGGDSCPLYDRPDGFGIEPSEGPILIENTVAMHNYGDGLDSKARNTTINRCIVANNSCDGVKVWGDNSRVVNTLIYGRGDRNPTVTPWAALVIDQVEQPDATFQVINCTIDDTIGNGYLCYVQYDNPVPVRLLLRNNIFCGRGADCPIYIGSAVALNADHNLFYLPRSTFVLEHGGAVFDSSNIAGLGPGNIFGNPGFLRTAWGTEGDYHLNTGSPALDAGTAEGAPGIDLDGNPRPQGAGFDIGCYER